MGVTEVEYLLDIRFENHKNHVSISITQASVWSSMTLIIMMSSFGNISMKISPQSFWFHCKALCVLLIAQTSKSIHPLSQSLGYKKDEF